MRIRFLRALGHRPVDPGRLPPSVHDDGGAPSVRRAPLREEGARVVVRLRAQAPREGATSSEPWLPVPCVRTGSQPRLTGAAETEASRVR